jgi:hypothetical protein
MWDFNWGMFRVLVAYGEFKFGWPISLMGRSWMENWSPFAGRRELSLLRICFSQP